ncbi:TIGR03936 family radical SAM-associated protein [Haloimpatiens sp. FM7315]|uniref:TIGR03936 family radical SAM-associated protein n=1 Tax=Haloimpatiens sp. FM7315 TaxID=3298609 RepID=UPI00370B3665
MRYLIKCTKEDEIKFISHLDFLRTLQRIIRRTDLKAEYSKGFNPHLALSIAQPLSVGVFSSAEYCDVYFEDEVDENEIKNKLMGVTPRGVKILDVVKALEDKKLPPSMALVEAASHIISIPFEKTLNLEAEFKKLLSSKEWNIIKKSKKGDREVNIKPLIKKISYKIEDNNLILDVLTSCGSKENLSPQLLAEYIQKNLELAEKEKFVKIQRKEIYTYKDDKLISLLEYFKTK